MKIVLLNLKTEESYETVFEISKGRKLKVLSKNKLTYRDIRIIQLCLILYFDRSLYEITLEELRQNLKYLDLLDAKDTEHIKKAFNTSDPKVHGYIEKLEDLDDLTISIIENSTANDLELYLIKNNTSLEKAKKMSLKKLGIERYEIFNKKGIKNVGKLMEYSPKELLKIRGIGTITIKELQEKLSMLGFVEISLKEEKEP